jgi:segregation and condensation protein A
MTVERPSSIANPPMPTAVHSEASGNTTYRVTLPEFEGPLDLLLHLCQTHELDILNISIAFIAEKYIEYLEVMQNMSVEVAADYLVMAAHLAYLKSRELVPSPEPLETSEEGEEAIDPREELIRRLLEYQKYKHAAENLGNRPIEGRNVFVRGMPQETTDEAGLAEHSVWKLLEHWAQIIEKAKPQYTHDVVMDRMSITDRINQIVDLLEAGKGMVRFEDLLGQNLTEAELRHKVVVSLLAVLELARLREIRIFHQESTGTFFLAQVEGAALNDARNLMVTSAKQNDEDKANSTDGQAQPATSGGETPTATVSSEQPSPAAHIASDTDTAFHTSSETVTVAVAETISDTADNADASSVSDSATTFDTATVSESDSVFDTVSVSESDSVPDTVPVSESDSVPDTVSVSESDSVPDTVSVSESATVSETVIASDVLTNASDTTTSDEAQASADSTSEIPLFSAENAPTETTQPAISLAPEEVTQQTATDATPSEPQAVVEASDSGRHSEILASDTTRLHAQEEVISAPFPAPAKAGQETTDGQTQEEQEATKE